MLLDGHAGNMVTADPASMAWTSDSSADDQARLSLTTTIGSQRGVSHLQLLVPVALPPSDDALQVEGGTEGIAVGMTLRAYQSGTIQAA